MGAPILSDTLIPVRNSIRTIMAEGREFHFIPVSMGNPHAVIFLEENLKDFPVEKFGTVIENTLDIFPRKVNVEFVSVLSPTHIDMRVWER